MRAVNIHATGDVRIDDIPTPLVGPADVLVKVADKLISHRFNFDQFSDAAAMARTAASRKVMVEFEV